MVISKQKLIALAASGAAAVGLLANAGTAQAGTYTVNQCNAPNAHPSNAIANEWQAQFNGADGNLVGFDASCADNGVFGFYGAQLSYGYPNNGAYHGIKLTVPQQHQAITIEQATLWWRLLKYSGGSWAKPCVYPSGSISGNGASCYDWVINDTFDHINSPTVHNLAGNKSFGLGVFCSQSQPGQNCGWNNGASGPIMDVKGVRFLLKESVDPSSVQITGGTLIDDETVQGNKTVKWSAADGDSGIAKIVVEAGDTTIATQDWSDDFTICPKITWTACDNSHSGTTTIDTTKIPDGNYTITVTAYDLAGNSKTVSTANKTKIDNVADPTPVPIIPPGGDPDKRGIETIMPEPVAGTVKVVFSASSSRNRLVRYGQRVTVKGRLLKPEGTPVVGGIVRVMSRVDQQGATWKLEGTTVSKADGSWSYRTKVGPTRTFRFEYKTEAASSSVSQTDDVKISVRAGITIRARKRGRVVVFSGVLKGRPKATGKIIQLQATDRGVWRTFSNPRVRKGSWRKKITFRKGPKRALKFRVRVPGDKTYPYETGASRVLRITLR